MLLTSLDIWGNWAGNGDVVHGTGKAEVLTEGLHKHQKWYIMQYFTA